MKIFRLPLALALIALFATGVLPVYAAIPPHVNPEEAPIEFDGVVLLERFSRGADKVIARDPDGAGVLLEQTQWAHIPDDLRGSAEEFFSSARELGLSIIQIEQNIEYLQELIEQTRVTDALELTHDTRQKILHAYSELDAMEARADDAGTWWRVERAPSGSALDRAWQELQARLAQIRALLDFLQLTNISSDEQAKGIIEGGSLQLSELSLEVEPVLAFVGDTIKFEGRLVADENPLGGRSLIILLDGVPVKNVITGNDGKYEGELQLPYEYVDKKHLRAVFLPRGADAGVYTGASSPQVEIAILYYSAVLELENPQEVYPGRDFLLEGSIDYGNHPSAESRQISVYSWGELIANEVVGSRFELSIDINPDTGTGTKRYSVYVTAHERYAPVSAVTRVEVIKIKPIIWMEAPGVAFLPMDYEMEGRVDSETGYVSGATVEVRLGEWVTTTQTRPDGTFSIQLETSINLTLVGAQHLNVKVVPNEPWYTTAQAEARIMVINPLNIAGLLIIAVVPAVLGLRTLAGRGRINKRGKRSKLPSEELIPVKIKELPGSSRQEPGNVGNNSRGVVIVLYMKVVRAIQTFTSLIIQGNQTLREYAREVNPKLGPLAVYFNQLTLLVEKVLYSGQPAEKNDVEHGRELGKRILMETGNEDN